MNDNIDFDITGNVSKLESFGLVDGPGVRFVVFLSGCKMRCKFCHNPETWNGVGEKWTAKKLFEHIRRYRDYWKKNGGITVSGGEPLLQMKFVKALFTLAKKENIHTAIDTSGQPFDRDSARLSEFAQLAEVTDLFILDIKDMNPGGHKALTGVDNANILEMAKWLSDHNKKMWIRHVLVPGITDREEDLKALHDFISTLKTVERAEILPYHTFGIPKWEELGIEYPLKDIRVPTEEEIKRAEDILQA